MDVSIKGASLQTDHIMVTFQVTCYDETYIPATQDFYAYIWHKDHDTNTTVEDLLHKAWGQVNDNVQNYFHWHKVMHKALSRAIGTKYVPVNRA